MATIELGTHRRGPAERYRECLEACVGCLVACEMCSDACLDEQDVKRIAPCIRLDRDCADACDACAAECERHAGMAEHCRVCAGACRRIAA